VLCCVVLCSVGSFVLSFSNNVFMLYGLPDLLIATTLRCGIVQTDQVCNRLQVKQVLIDLTS